MRNCLIEICDSTAHFIFHFWIVNQIVRSTIVTTIKITIVPVFGALVATFVTIAPTAVVALVELALDFNVRAHALTVFSRVTFGH